MPPADPRIDAYAARSAEFAQPILAHLRAVVHSAPKRQLVRHVKKAMALTDAGVTTAHRARKSPVGKPAPRTPPDLAAALAMHDAARAVSDAFPPSHRREYIEWITGAKRAGTRARRIEQAVAWITEGKGRNWRYERA